MKPTVLYLYQEFASQITKQFAVKVPKLLC